MTLDELLTTELDKLLELEEETALEIDDTGTSLDDDPSHT